MKTIDKINYLFVFVQFLFLFASSRGYETYKLYFVLVEICFLFFYFQRLKFNKYILIFIFLLILANPYAVTSIIYCFCSYLFAIRLIRLDQIKISNIIKGVLFIQITYVLIIALQGTNPNEFINASRNHVAVPFIFFGSLNFFLERKNNLYSNKLWYLFILLICVWSISRANIISGAVLFLMSFFSFKNKSLISKHKKVISLISVSSFIAFILYYLENIKELLFVKSFTLVKFFDDRNSVLENERFGLIDKYIEGLNFIDYIFGKSVDYNIHNSYINLHALFGIFGFLFFIFLAYKMKKRIIFLIPVLLRSFTDTISFFGGELDFIFFYLAFL
jgi:hypothetical protein